MNGLLLENRFRWPGTLLLRWQLWVLISCLNDTIVTAPYTPISLNLTQHKRSKERRGRVKEAEPSREVHATWVLGLILQPEDQALQERGCFPNSSIRADDTKHYYQPSGMGRTSKPINTWEGSSMGLSCAGHVSLPALPTDSSKEPESLKYSSRACQDWFGNLRKMKR